MTKKKPDAPSGFKRLSSGVLVWLGGVGTRGYRDPGEAIVAHWAGKLVFKCNERVFGQWNSGYCSHAPKHDPDANGRPTKCGHHSAAGKAKKKAKQDTTTARWHREWAARDALHAATRRIEGALREISAGHNDPRSLARETIEALDAARAESAAAQKKG